MTDLKTKLRDPALRLSAQLCTIPSAAITQAVASAGADAVLIDMEHGAVDFGTLHAMIAATQGTDCAPLVRVPKIDEAAVKTALDMGAEGIVFPMVRSAADAARAVASLRYPPAGTRGFGPFLAQSRWGTSLATYRETMEPRLVACLLVETADAVEDIDAICATDGIDFIVPAQFDLSTDLGIPGQFDHPDFRAAVARVRKAADGAGIPLGQIALTESDARARFDEGYRVIVGLDVAWLKSAVAQHKAWTV